jgi:hypothetical protein
MLAINQKPERVSNILRSSTAVMRVSGIRLVVVPGTARTWSAAMVLMPVLLLVGWRR